MDWGRMSVGVIRWHCSIEPGSRVAGCSGRYLDVTSASASASMLSDHGWEKENLERNTHGITV